MTAPQGSGPRGLLERTGPRSVGSALGFEIHEALPRHLEYREGARALRFAAARGPTGGPAFVIYDGLGSSQWEPPHDGEPIGDDKKHQILVRVTAALTLLEVAAEWQNLSPAGSPHDWRAIQAEAGALVRRAE